MNYALPRHLQYVYNQVVTLGNEIDQQRVETGKVEPELETKLKHNQELLTALEKHKLALLDAIDIADSDWPIQESGGIMSGNGAGVGGESGSHLGGVAGGTAGGTVEEITIISSGTVASEKPGRSMPMGKPFANEDERSFYTDLLDLRELCEPELLMPNSEPGTRGEGAEHVFNGFLDRAATGQDLMRVNTCCLDFVTE